MEMKPCSFPLFLLSAARFREQCVNPNLDCPSPEPWEDHSNTPCKTSCPEGKSPEGAGWKLLLVLCLEPNATG